MNLNGIILSKLVYLKIVKSAKTNLTIVKFYFFFEMAKRDQGTRVQIIDVRIMKGSKDWSSHNLRPVTF